MPVTQPVSEPCSEIEAALELYLVSLSGVAEMVGKKIAPTRSAMGVDLPRLVYQTIEDTPFMTTKGETGTRKTTILLSCWGRSSGEAKRLSEEVCGTPTNRRLAAYQGYMPRESSASRVWVQYARVSTRAAEQETPAQGDDGGEHRRLLELTVFWNVPA